MLFLTTHYQTIICSNPLNIYNGLSSLFVIIYLAWNAIRMCLVGIYSTLIYSFATIFHMATIERSLEQLLRKLFQSKRPYNSFHLLVNKLYFIRCQHCNLTLKAYRFNQNISSNGFMATIGTNWGVSIWMITLLVYGNLNTGQTILFLMLTTSQILIIYSFSYLLLIWSDSLRSTNQILFPSQLCLNQSYIWTKLKLMTHYEMVNSKKPFRFRMCMIEKLSKQFILKVSQISNNIFV